MHESERNRIHREIRMLLLAEQDMKLAADAAEALEDDHPSVPRVLETGLVVTYARPYTLDNKRRGLPDNLLPDAEDRPFHNRLLDLRDELYAHTDRRAPREAVDPFGDHSYAEQYPAGLKDGALRRIAELGTRQAQRFREEREKLEEHLRAAGVPADRML